VVQAKIARAGTLASGDGGTFRHARREAVA